MARATVAVDGGASSVQDSALRPYKVVFIESSVGTGGSITFLRSLFTYLNRNRFNPVLINYFRNASAAAQRIEEMGIPVAWLKRKAPAEPRLLAWFEQTRFYRCRPLRIASNLSKQAYRFVRHAALQTELAARLYRRLKREGAELAVLNQDVCLHLPGAVAAKLAGVPCICRKAGGIGEDESGKRISVPLVDLFVAVSEATAADQRGYPATKRLELIYEGVDLKRFGNQKRDASVAAELGIPPGRKVVACVARICEGKGQRELIRAAQIVVRKHKQAAFLIVGEDDPPGAGLKAQLQELVRELHLEEHVIFPGCREDMPRVLSVVDVMAHCPTTWIEGLSIACLEAAAMGKPIVGSKNGGIPDVVIDGVTGLLVQPGDVEGMAAAIAKLLEDDSLRARLGANNRRRAEQNFDAAKCTEQLESLFEEYAAAGRNRKF